MAERRTDMSLMQSFRRGTGWVRGPRLTTERFRASSAHVAAANAAADSLPASFSLKGDGFVQDQGAEESCTARMGVAMLYDLTGEKCSVYVPWWAAREYDAPGPLSNVGCSADGFTWALENHGACLLSDLPTLGLVEVPPALKRISAQKRKLDIVPIYAVGIDAVRAAQHALVQGFPCGVVVSVDDGYEHPVNGFVGPESGPSRGTHAIAVRAYRTADDGTIQFRSPGSWGPGWDVWLDESRIRVTPWLGFGRLP